jgi:hypothetical protein
MKKNKINFRFFENKILLGPSASRFDFFGFFVVCSVVVGGEDCGSGLNSI